MRFITIFFIFFTGCYTPVIYFDNISINNDLSNNKNNIEYTPFLFYKECSRNGNIWLYECQGIGLKSIQQAIYLYHDNIELKNIKMFFYANKNYIRFEIYDPKIINFKN